MCVNLHFRVGSLRTPTWNMYQNPYQNNYPLWSRMEVYIHFYIALLFITSIYYLYNKTLKYLKYLTPLCPLSSVMAQDLYSSPRKTYMTHISAFKSETSWCSISSKCTVELLQNVFSVWWQIGNPWISSVSSVNADVHTSLTDIHIITRHF